MIHFSTVFKRILLPVGFLCMLSVGGFAQTRNASVDGNTLSSFEEAASMIWGQRDVTTSIDTVPTHQIDIHKSVKMWYETNFPNSKPKSLFVVHSNGSAYAYNSKKLGCDGLLINNTVSGYQSVSMSPLHFLILGEVAKLLTNYTGGLPKKDFVFVSRKLPRASIVELEAEKAIYHFSDNETDLSSTVTVRDKPSKKLILELKVTGIAADRMHVICD